ncbi:hypothetical protein PC128_g8828 [Phytophthora cactorum]|nr:hypothetical protein PC128_g8828 [Phytophthora cactorum]
MYNTVHLDENIFYITRPRRRFLLLPDELAPTRRVKSRRFVTRDMMLAAVSRPRYDSDGAFFDGKLGIWAFTEQAAAVRQSAGRPAGTLETKEVSVTKSTYREKLVSKALPEILVHWPGCGGVVLQQDNAPTHISPSNPEFAAAVERSGILVELRCQPPNSPDLNCCDLGVFTAIQARQQEKTARNIDELIAATTEASWELPPRVLNAAFLSLHSCMDLFIQANGDNNFKPPHMGKLKLEREGRLPTPVSCSPKTAAIIAASPSSNTPHYC